MRYLRKKGRGRLQSMEPHVDVYTTDWSSKVQRVVARVRLVDETLEFEVLDDRYKDIVCSPLTDLGTGQAIDPHEQPVEFYKRLHDHLRGSYIGATTPHNGDCPFSSEGVAPFATAPREVSVP